MQLSSYCAYIFLKKYKEILSDSEEFYIEHLPESGFFVTTTNSTLSASTHSGRDRSEARQSFINMLPGLTITNVEMEEKYPGRIYTNKLKLHFKLISYFSAIFVLSESDDPPFGTLKFHLKWGIPLLVTRPLRNVVTRLNSQLKKVITLTSKFL